MIGSLGAIIIAAFYLPAFYLFANQIPLKTRLLVFTLNPSSKLLVNTFCSSLGSTLLFIGSTAIHPLYLWVINRVLVPGACALAQDRVDPPSAIDQHYRKVRYYRPFG